MKLFQVDAFTDKKFRGNPAGVYLLESAPSRDFMQSWAAEMNLSETAFVWPASSDFENLAAPIKAPITPADYHIRFFTPTLEIPLCGHATLSSAHILWEQNIVNKDTSITFYSPGGTLYCHPNPDNSVRMNFPIDLPKPQSLDQGWATILGVKPVEAFVGKAWTGLVLPNADAVRSVLPDLSKTLQEGRGHFLVTALSNNPEFDIESRCFAPDAGIPEDPVTGSAHCLIASFWSSRLKKPRLQCYQASKRGGQMQTHVLGERVELTGHAVTVFEAILA